MTVLRSGGEKRAALVERERIWRFPGIRPVTAKRDSTRGPGVPDRQITAAPTIANIWLESNTSPNREQISIARECERPDRSVRKKLVGENLVVTVQRGVS